MEYKKMKLSKKQIRVVQIIIVFAIVVCGFWVYNNNKVEDLPKVDSIVEKIDKSIKNGVYVSNPIDFDTYWKINEDVYAYIYIDGTTIDYPILQHPSDDSYYLDHTIERVKVYPASIYTEGLNKKDFSDRNTLIYGHNMNVNGTMFNAITNYADETFFNEHKTFYIYTPTKILQYEVFAAYENDDSHLMYQYDFNDDTSSQTFLDDVKRKAGERYDASMKVAISDHLVTLSTCSEIDNNRFIVHAKLMQSVDCDYKSGRYVEKQDNQFKNMKKSD